MVKIKAITHRKDPISFGLICGRIEDYPRPLMRSNTLLDVLVAKSGLTNIKEVFFPDAGRSGFLIIRAQITTPDQPKQIIDAAYQHMRYRWVIVVDEDCNVRDWNDVLWRIVSSVVPDRDMFRGREYVFKPPHPGSVEFVPPTYGMAFDATFPFKEYEHPRPGVAQPSMKMMEHVAGTLEGTGAELGVVDSSFRWNDEYTEKERDSDYDGTERAGLLQEHARIHDDPGGARAAQADQRRSRSRLRGRRDQLPRPRPQRARPAVREHQGQPRTSSW